MTFIHFFLTAVIGAGDNKYCQIRKGISEKDLIRANTPNILPTGQPLPLKIRLTKDGVLSAEINGRNEIIVKLTIENPRNIKYFALGSWNNLIGKWFFDCKNDAYSELGAKENDNVDLEANRVDCCCYCCSCYNCYN